MIERPILFSTPMVQAILVGNKTQTRRVVKPRKDLLFGCLLQPHELAGEVNAGDTLNCPYGQVGDQLWVRETWNGPFFEGDLPEDWREEKYKTPGYCVYRASGHSCEYVDADDNVQQRWKPSIHMPRWASRIQLEITGIRVERLQDISGDDAECEGIESCSRCGGYGFIEQGGDVCDCPMPECGIDATELFKRLWESINGAGSWDANPWVWAISFKRVEVPA